MTMSRKMILLFFLMILAIVMVNTYYLSFTNIVGSDAFSAGRYKNMADSMVRNTEQYFTLMDLAIDELISDAEFLEAFSQIAEHGDEDLSAARSWQNKIADKLYHSAIGEHFFRVSIFSENVYYLSNHMDRNDSLSSFSDEARETINAVPYLEQARQKPYARHVIGPHIDYFTLGKEVSVFSILRCITLHGKDIGFIEVSADIADLEDIFRADSPDVMTHAVFQDGTVLFHTGDVDAIYENIALNALQDYTDPNGLELNVYHTQSRWLELDIYLSQNASVRFQNVHHMVTNYICVSAIVACVALGLVVLISLRLTRSIRQLTTKVQTLSAERLMKGSNPPHVDSFVTSARDREIYQLEKQFNTLVANLQTASKNEIAMRESTTNARLNALQAQINPHFVYNTLNIIAAKGMESGNEEVVDLCAQFGQMLRYSTDTRSKSVFVWEDVEHVTNYLMLLKARYEDGLEYTIQIPQEMQHIKIPRLTLQPLVENSIVHGFDSTTEIRKIQIQGQLENGQMLLEIRDNGSGFPPEVLSHLQSAIQAMTEHPTQEPEGSGHIGMLNTCWRLLHYSKDIPISMEIGNDHGALVRLRIPITQPESE